MTEIVKYIQCRLMAAANDVGHRAETVAWIEDRGAKLGSQVELLSADGQFWEVTAVYKGNTLTEHALRAKQAMDRGSLGSIKVIR